MDQRFCTSCGERLEESARFCTNCGQARAAAQPDTVPVPVQKPAAPMGSPALRQTRAPRALTDHPSNQKVLIAALVVGALLLGGGAVYALTSRANPAETSAPGGNFIPNGTPSNEPSTTAPLQPSPSPPAPKNTLSDLQIATTTIERYTNAINDSDQSAACAINTADNCAALWAGAKDSVWTDVRITGVSRTGHKSLTVYFTGKTTQPPGMGPAGHTYETCTRWELGYRLKQRGAQWYIVGGIPGDSDYRC